MSESARIVNAITGETVSINIKIFVSLDDFKDFVSHRWHIPSDQLLILLPFGHKLKISTFKECLKSSALERYEFYIYDRRLFSMVNEPVEVPLIENHRSGVQELLSSYVIDSMFGHESNLLKPINSPLLSDELNLQELSYRSITSLLTTNLGWLSALEIDVHYFRTLLRDCTSQMNEILQCLSVCDQYLKLYCFDVERLYNSNVEFLDQLLQNGLSSKWKQCYNDVLSHLNGLHGPLQQYVDKKLLDRKEEVLNSLDRRVNSKLKVIKKKLDSNADLRKHIEEEVVRIRTEFVSSKTEDKLEDAMQGKFDELVEETRSKSRNFLDQDSSEFTDSHMEEIRDFFHSIKNEVAAKLFTIAQSLFTQTEKFRNFKFRLQEKVVMAFGQIAFVQVESLALKKSLLVDCNEDLGLYQKYELEFAQIEDLPMIYGLYLIEKYRRESWLLQIMSHGVLLSTDLRKVMETEVSCRNKWIKNFGDIASIFRNDLDSFSDIDNFDKMFNGGMSNVEKMHEEHIRKYKKSLEVTLKVIEEYMNTLSLLEVPKTVLEILMQNLAEAKSFQIVTNQSFLSHESIDTPNQTQLNGYRARIKKLESLLYEVKISDTGHWPSGIFHASRFKPFHNNVSTVSSKIIPNSSGLLDPNQNINSVKVLEMEKEMQNLKEQVQKFHVDNNMKKDQILAAGSKVSDLELERGAFRETMLNLNKELSRLTEQEERYKGNLIQRQSMYQDQLSQITNENKNLLQEMQNLNQKLQEFQETKEQKEQDIAKLKEDFNVEKRKLEDDSQKLERENGDLKEKLKSLEQALTKFEESQEEKTMKESSQILGNDGTVRLKAFEGEMESKMFEIFSSDVFILENIGLLLLLDEDRNVQIKRVKGLKKGMNQSILEDSIHAAPPDVLVKSPVYHSIKSVHDEIQKGQEIDKYKFLLESMDKLYDDKLYETAVIKRFRDIESLAKKLTKENKKKKDTLEKLQNEKITLKNLQVNDLALFLPTRKTNSPIESSASSLNSSFSSVDLSTPPPLDTTPIHPVNKERNRKDGKQPWAAFTALDDNTRYFLKDDNEVTRGKDWFVGRITNLKQIIADSPANNPYKLEKNAVWFQVSATIIAYQN